MNFYCYEINELSDLHGFQTENVSLHKFFSHQSNSFLSNLKNFSTTKKENSYFFVPIVIRAKKQASIEEINHCFVNLSNRLKYFKEKKEKHIFFYVGDSYLFSNLANCINFMQSCHKENRCNALHYTSPLCSELSKSKEISEAFIDISFQGNINTNKCRKNIFSIKSKFTTKIVCSPSVQPQNQKLTWQKSYMELIDNSKFILCPRGNGLNSIRFFEALAAGRVPVLISNKCKLPLENFINWNELIIKINKNTNYENLDFLIENFIKKNDLSEISKKLKKIWNNYFLELDKFFMYNFFRIHK